jgi:hypothetical protein
MCALDCGRAKFSNRAHIGTKEVNRGTKGYRKKWAPELGERGRGWR